MKKSVVILTIIVWLATTIISFNTFLAPLQPQTREIKIQLPEKAELTKAVVSEISLSGTVVTVPLEVYQSIEFKEQIAIVQFTRAKDAIGNALSYHVIKVHYLGKTSSISYRAMKDYILPGWPTTIYYENFRIEDNVVKYTASGDPGQSLICAMGFALLIAALTFLGMTVVPWVITPLPKKKKRLLNE